MAIYTIHSLFNSEENFLQMSHNLPDLARANKSKITRWISEMGVKLLPKDTTLLIKENGLVILTAKMAPPIISWKEYVPQNPTNTRDLPVVAGA